MVPYPPTAFVAMPLRVISGIGTPAAQQIELNVCTTCVFCSACGADFREEFNIPGFTSNVLACKDAGAVPTWLNQWFFYLASLCCLTVPYRIAFAKLCWEVPE